MTSLWDLFGIKGRINRKTFWVQGILPILIIELILYLITRIMGNSDFWIVGAGFITSMYMLIAVSAKRSHDLGNSGWVGVVSVVPLLGFFAILLFGISSGQQESNAFGSVPD